MKKITSRIVAIALALVMVFSFSGCSIMGAEFSDLMDFVLNGWDGIYEEKEPGPEYVAPNPKVRTNEIRENHRVTTVNNPVVVNHRVTTVNNPVVVNHRVTTVNNPVVVNHRVTTVNNPVVENHRVTTVNNVVGSGNSSSTSVAKTDVPN